MYRKIPSTVIIIGFLILCSPAKTQALDPMALPPELKEALDQQRRKPLRGLPGIVVTIEHIYPDIMLEGISAEQITQLVTKLLKEAGIKTATVEECAMYVADLRKKLGEQGQLDRKVLTEGPCAFPDLYVNVNAHRVENGFVYSVRLQILEDVSPERDPSMIVQAATWDKGAVGIGTGSVPKVV